MSGFVDVHCHVLPGVDDGAPDLATSLAFLRAAAAAGTAAIVATPHQHPGRYPNRADALRRAHDELAEALQEARAAGETLPDVHLGAEVHLDVGLEDLIAGGERLTLAAGPYVLLELPDMFRLEAVEELVFRLQVAGTTPVLAHPERIGQIVRQPDQLRRLVERGALAQATGSSIAGVFGEPCRARTEAWLREGLLHVFASDAHELQRRTPSLAAAHAAVAATFGEALAAEMFVSRPLAILQGRPLNVPPAATVPPEPGARGPLAGLKRLFRS